MNTTFAIYMKKFIVSALIVTTITVYAMERPTNTKKVEIKLKDHISLPDGGHMRMVYHPLHKRMDIASFNSHCNHVLSYAQPVFEFRDLNTHTPLKIELTKICGIAQYKHYLLYTALGSLHQENDIVILGEQNNLNKKSTACAIIAEPDICFIDTSSIVITKTKVKVCGVCMHKKTGEYLPTINIFKKKVFMPDVNT